MTTSWGRGGGDEDDIVVTVYVEVNVTVTVCVDVDVVLKLVNFLVGISREEKRLFEVSDVIEDSFVRNEFNFFEAVRADGTKRFVRWCGTRHELRPTRAVLS